jgi:quinol monooxygenase YgiN
LNVYLGEYPREHLRDLRNAMSSENLVRMAHIVVKSTHLEHYKAALREEIEASLQHEPGVLGLYAVTSKEDPAKFTILEVYASHAAYAAHLTTPHFLKYKTTTQDMVASLELVETVPLIPELKIW